MKERIAKFDWDRVQEVACEFANAVIMEDVVLSESKRESVMDLLDELEIKYGERARITATRGDFLENPHEAEKCFERALELSRAENDPEEEFEILDSIRRLES